MAGAGRLPSLLAAAAYCITPYLLRLTIYLFMNVLVGWWLRQARLMAGCPVPRLAGQWQAVRAAPASGYYLPPDVETSAHELPGRAAAMLLPAVLTLCTRHSPGQPLRPLASIVTTPNVAPATSRGIHRRMDMRSPGRTGGSAGDARRRARGH